MSWSIAFIGNPENVVSALKNHSIKLADASKMGYDAVLPHMVGIVQQNFNTSEGSNPVVKIEASGSGYDPTDGKGANRTCKVNVEPIFGLII